MVGRSSALNRAGRRPRRSRIRCGPVRLLARLCERRSFRVRDRSARAVGLVPLRCAATSFTVLRDQSSRSLPNLCAARLIFVHDGIFVQSPRCRMRAARAGDDDGRQEAVASPDFLGKAPVAPRPWEPVGHGTEDAPNFATNNSQRRAIRREKPLMPSPAPAVRGQHLFRKVSRSRKRGRCASRTKISSSSPV
jgi:hypothetical protein